MKSKLYVVALCAGQLPYISGDESNNRNESSEALGSGFRV
jgi:hypothetical protein